MVDSEQSCRCILSASQSYAPLQTDASDFYFLAHGLNFKQALYDFASISGQIALPPRAAFGPWWSRYWPYTAETIVTEVLSGYANYSIPLTALVLDMDWYSLLFP